MSNFWRKTGVLTEAEKTLLSNEEVEKLLKERDDAATQEYWNTVGLVSDVVNTLLPRNYDNEYGKLKLGLDSAFDGASNIASMIGPVGSIVGGVMKGVSALNGVMGNIGGGTDNMTQTDAILGSNFLAPIGWINGFGGSKAMDYTQDAQVDADTGGSFNGFLTDESDAMIKSGKKYGLFSQGAKKAANDEIDNVAALQLLLKNIETTNNINKQAALGSTPFLTNMVNISQSGGVGAAQVGREGLKFARRVLSQHNIELFKKGGITLAEETPWYKESPVYNTEYGNNPVMTSLDKEDIVNYVNQFKNVEWVNRLLDPNRKSLQYPGGLIGSFKMSYYYDKNAKEYRVFAAILDKNGQLVDLSGDKDMQKTVNDIKAGKNKNYIPFKSKLAADWFSSDNYKAYYQGLEQYAPGYNKLKDSEANDEAEVEFYKEGGSTEYVKRMESSTKKYVFIPKKLTKEQARGSKVIKTKDGKEVCLQGDGNVIYINAMHKQIFKEGGSVNVIPEGALHKNKHHLEDVDDKFEDVTEKGIPVITEEKGEVILHAEVEKEEIIFRLEVTKKLEELAKKKTDEAAIEAGKLVTYEILYNTEDNADIIDKYLNGGKI